MTMSYDVAVWDLLLVARWSRFPLAVMLQSEFLTHFMLQISQNTRFAAITFIALFIHSCLLARGILNTTVLWSFKGLSIPNVLIFHVFTSAFNPSGSAVCEIPWLDNYHGHLNPHSGACFDLWWVSACLNRLSCRTCGQLLDNFPNVQLNSWTRWSDSETGECSCSQLRHGVLCSSATFAQMLIDKWWLQLPLEI